MRLLILSDLHLEMGELDLVVDGRRIDDDVGVVVLAGDVMDGLQGPSWARDAFPDKEIVLVPGNHELYEQDWLEGVERLREESARHGIHFLEDSAVDLGGVRFLGCSLWTDYCLHGHALQHKRMLEVEGLMTDFKEITVAGKPLASWAVLGRHKMSRQWLQQELASCEFGRTVVVTHHAPHPRSINRYDGLKPVAAAYASDLEELMGYASLWVHGHVHEVADYEVHGTRVVCNPRGYLAPDGEAMSGWNPCFTVDI